MRLFILLGALIPCIAQAQEVPRTSLRYDEDWSKLPADQRTGWLQVKYLELDRRGDIHLTLGAEMRARFESFDNRQWGDQPAPDDSYLWLRAMPHADLHAGPARVFVQGIAGYARGVSGGKGPVDETGMDLLQGFADVRLRLGDKGRLTLRGGRALIALGSERLVGTRYGTNIPQPFDGVRATADHGRVRIDVMRLRPVAIGGSDFDDKRSRTRRLDGVYAAITPTSGVGVDAYWLGYENLEASFAGRTDREKRDTFGVRVFGTQGQFGWNWEAMLQRGRFGADKIRSWSLATETSWRFKDAPWSPNLRLRANIASGDRAPGDGRLGTFNPLFPKAKYFGDLSPIGPRNIMNIHPSLQFNPGSDVTVELSAARFWRESRADGVYDIPGQLLRPAGASRARHIGDQVEITAGWQISDILSLSGSLSAFRPGVFIRETGRARTIRMAGVEAMAKF